MAGQKAALLVFLAALLLCAPMASGFRVARMYPGQRRAGSPRAIFNAVAKLVQEVKLVLAQAVWATVESFARMQLLLVVVNRVPQGKRILEAAVGVSKLSMFRANDRRFLAAAELAVERTRINQHFDSTSRRIKNIKLYKEKKNRSLNAFALPVFSAVAVTQGFLDLGIPREVMAALVAHEFGHILRRHDIFQHLKRAAIVNCGSLLISKLVSISSPLAVVASGLKSIVAVLEFLGVEPIDKMLSRSHEIEADSIAGEALGENNMNLALQTMAGVPCWLIRLQHAFGTILLRPWMFRDWHGVEDSKIGWERVWVLTFGRDWDEPAAKPLPKKALAWILGSTHPSFEDRMNQLFTQKRERSLSALSFLEY